MCEFRNFFSDVCFCVKFFFFSSPPQIHSRNTYRLAAIVGAEVSHCTQLTYNLWLREFFCLTFRSNTSECWLRGISVCVCATLKKE